MLADFGIAKMLDNKDEVLTTMAGSFGYAAPEVMLKKGHGKPVDMWSMGVITYTLLGGYSPFRSENVQDLIEETSSAGVVFHSRYWQHVSNDAKHFIMGLLNPDPEKRWDSKVSTSRNKTRPLESVCGHRAADDAFPREIASSWPCLAHRQEC